MKKYSLFIASALVISLSSCKENNTQQLSVVETPKPLLPVENTMSDKLTPLLWVETANAQADAKTAIENSNTKLWVYRTRIGTKVPGLEDQDTQYLEEKYGFNYAPAMGDIVYGDKHLQLRLKFIEYAKQYNRIIAQ